MLLLRFDLTSKAVPVEKLALELNSFFEVIIESIIAVLVYIVSKFSIELENFLILLASLTQYLLNLILKIFDIEIFLFNIL